MLNKVDINKFSFAQAMSNSNGKTSGSKFAGFLALVTGMIGLICSLFFELMKSVNSVTFLTVSAGLITSSLIMFGYSKKKATKDTTNVESTEE